VSAHPSLKKKKRKEKSKKKKKMKKKGKQALTQMPLAILHIHHSRNRELPCNGREPMSGGRVDNKHHKKLQHSMYLAH
jgi:hypothetical protein